ncbi:hypothetical protein L915_19994 [Phytophthora nicotianae]|uniref:Uncharacterized protein n=1 Tax=Phytophthora nicotianae TaxID=4792 RepID=W2FSX8_PHYNI|nr:hypothetical protein L915_19994 [Phytophthora nicotianae]
MLEPLLEHLSGLSSANFYEELWAWKEMVEVGLRRFSKAYSGHDVDTDGRTDGENASDAGVLSTLKPADAIGMAKFMEEMEMANVESVSETRSDSDVPQTQPAAVAVVSTPVAGTKSEADESLQQERVLPISLEATTTIPTSRDREGVDEADRNPDRQVDIISMPKPKRRNNPSAITKQLPQTRLIPEPEYKHNFAIPMDLTRSMQAAITTAKRKQCKPDELDESVEKHGIVLDVVDSIDPKLSEFRG